MYKAVLASAIGLVVSAGALAQSYRFEGIANYLSVKENSDFEQDSDGITAAGTYYFSPVITDNHPLREAAFLAKNSSVSIISNYTTSTNHYNYGSEYVRYETKYTQENTSIGVAAETYLFSGLMYLSGLFSHQQTKYTYTTETFSSTYPVLNSKDSLKNKDTDDQWRLNLGVAPIQGLLVWSEFSKDVHINHSWNLNAKYLMEFKGSALNIQGGLGENAYSFLGTTNTLPESVKLNFEADDNLNINSAYVLGDYYFDTTLSVGLGATYYDAKGGGNIDESYMIRSQKFLTDSFSIALQYTDAQFDKTYSIGASLRF